MGSLTYLVYRGTDGFAWRFPNGETPGEIMGPGEHGWIESVCSPRDFYVPNEVELFDRIEPGYTVTIEEMPA